MFTFKPATDQLADYQKMQQWLSQEDVFKWYGYDDFATYPTLEEAINKFQPAFQKPAQKQPTFIYYKGIAIGYLQASFTKEYLNEPGIMGIDFLIGEKAYRNQGLGTEILKEWLVKAQKNYSVKKFLVDPLKQNLRGIKTYEKSGFQKVMEQEEFVIMVYSVTKKN